MNNKIKLTVDNNLSYCLYKAKSTLWYFIEKVQEKKLDYFAIKFKNENDIYVWLENVKYENEYFSGTLSESKEKKTIPIQEVVDWMLIDNNRLIGGYTIRHYRNELSKDERLDFDIDFGLKIDNGNDFFYPDLSTPEGAIITLEIFYTEKSLDGALSCKDFYKEAENVLLEAGKDLDEELIQETAELLKLYFIEHLQKNGMPNFTDVERVFERIIYKEEENKQLIKEKIIYSNGEETINKFWLAKNEEKKWKVLDLI
ncbi:MAG: DUF2314 domain-containing protein [Cruoricaptor ignavus]|nr:DUF2314 domain-containing protein [Cruoricaptor ignavus]